MENILSVIEASGGNDITIEVIGDEQNIDELIDYYQGSDSISVIEPHAYATNYSPQPLKFPVWVRDYLKDTTLKKLFFKAGISNYCKDAYDHVRYRFYIMIRDIVLRANVIREHKDSKILKKEFVKYILDSQGNYLYEN